MSNLTLRKRELLLGVARFVVAAGVLGIATEASARINDGTLNYGNNATFLTGIRGDNIVGNYVIPGTSSTGGLLYDITTGVWSAIPVPTASGVNFPNANSSSPYGPSFGSETGILRAVGSYKEGSALDRSYLYDAAAAPGQHITRLDYPSTAGAQVLNTITHSTFGNQVVGNYDTRLATGNALIYNISTGTYTTNNMPGAASTTAYGVWGDKIAGGYFMAGPGGGIGFEHGYIYDQSTGTWTTYDHPGAVFTHFEGITGAGRAGEYNLVADWAGPDGKLHAGVLHIGADGRQTWIELPAIPGATGMSSDSAYGEMIIGTAFTANGANGFVVTIPGIYNPIRNRGVLSITAADTPALSGIKGDDIVNDGIIRTSGARSAGIRSETYGVVTNKGLISVSGSGSAGVHMHGSFGTLLNAGTIEAAPGAFAIRTGATASGTIVVNKGIIDGAVSVTAGPLARFENSGWLGISGAGFGVSHAVSGVFAQTARGTLALRVGAGGSDTLVVDGVARLGGQQITLVQPGGLQRNYTLLAASGGYTGRFDSATAVGLPSFVTASLSYGPNAVTLNLVSNISRAGGLTQNQAAVGGAVDAQFNSGSGNGLPSGLGAIYALPAAQLPGALGLLSGEIYAAVPSTLYTESGLVREAILGRLRGGVASLPLAGDANGPGTLDKSVFGVWGQGFGAWGRSGSNGNASTVERRTGGFVIGADVLTPLATAAPDVRFGIAGGYLTTNLDVDRQLSHGSSSSVFGALYAGTAIGQVKLSAGAIYLGSRIDANRAIQAGTFSDGGRAKQDATSIQAFGEAGYTLLAGRGSFGTLAYSASVEPFVNAAALRIRTESFAEAGGVAALAGFGRSYDIGTATLGARLEARFGAANGGAAAAEPFVLRASLGWRSAFGDVNPAALMAFRSALLAPGALSPFTVSSVPIDRGAIAADIGLDWQITNALSLGVSYAAQAGSNAVDQALKGKLEVRF